MNNRFKLYLVAVLVISFAVFANMGTNDVIKKDYSQKSQSPKVQLPLEEDSPSPIVSNEAESASQNEFSSLSNQPIEEKPFQRPIQPQVEPTNDPPVHPRAVEFGPDEIPNYAQTQKEVFQHLLEEPVEYPYEFDEELYDLSEKVLAGKANPKEVHQFMVRGVMPKKEKVKKANAVNKKEQTPQGKSVSDNSKVFASSTNSVFQSGYAQEYKKEAYQESANPIPSHLEFTHKNLKIYKVTPGPNASPMVRSLATLKVPVHEQKPDLEPYWHNHYRIGPDYNTRWDFADPNQKKGEMSNSEIARAKQAADQHLYSLGFGGSITFEITQGHLFDGEGDDFVIWSNPFCWVSTMEAREHIKNKVLEHFLEYIPHSGNTKDIIDPYVKCFTETAKVEVSADGGLQSWRAFGTCPDGNAKNSQCAGYGLNLWKQNKDPSDKRSGGDRFDLKAVDLETVRFIRITDTSHLQTQPDVDFKKVLLNGFDLDAIAILHVEE